MGVEWYRQLELAESLEFFACYLNTAAPESMYMKSIYLDHNATTPMHPEVSAAMAECYQLGPANASSLHARGRWARSIVEDARRRMAQILGAQLDGDRADKLVFTSGGTESNNLALFGLAGQRLGRVIISSLEHPSVRTTGEELARRGFDLVELPAQPNGQIAVESLSRSLSDDTRLVSVMWGNNETGVLQPVEEMAERCEAASVPLHTDAVQVVGKQPVDFRKLGAAAMSLSAHKFQGPVGIGALLLRGDAMLEPHLFGGFQQYGLRPGTQPLPQIVGMCKALEIWHRQAGQLAANMTAMRDQFESRLLAEIPNLVINGREGSRLPHTSNISFLELDRQALLMALDMAGIECSTGSACASGSTEPSHVLRAMGCTKAVIEGSLRFSFGNQMTPADMERAAVRICAVVIDLRNKKRATKTVAGPRGRRP